MSKDILKIISCDDIWKIKKIISCDDTIILYDQISKDMMEYLLKFNCSKQMEIALW